MNEAERLRRRHRDLLQERCESALKVLSFCCWIISSVQVAGSQHAFTFIYFLVISGALFLMWTAFLEEAVPVRLLPAAIFSYFELFRFTVYSANMLSFLTQNGRIVSFDWMWMPPGNDEWDILLTSFYISSTFIFLAFSLIVTKLAFIYWEGVEEEIEEERAWRRERAARPPVAPQAPQAAQRAPEERNVKRSPSRGEERDREEQMTATSSTKGDLPAPRVLRIASEWSTMTEV